MISHDSVTYRLVLIGTHWRVVQVVGISRLLPLSDSLQQRQRIPRSTVAILVSPTLLPHLHLHTACQLYDSTPSASLDGQKRCNVTAPCVSATLGFFRRQSLNPFPLVTSVPRTPLAPPPSPWDLQTIFDYFLFWHLAATQSSTPLANANRRHSRSMQDVSIPADLPSPSTASRPSPEILGFGAFDSPRTNRSDINLGHELLAYPCFPSNPAGSGWSLRVPACHGSCQFQAQTIRHTRRSSKWNAVCGEPVSITKFSIRRPRYQSCQQAADHVEPTKWNREMCPIAFSLDRMLLSQPSQASQIPPPQTRHLHYQVGYSQIVNRAKSKSGGRVQSSPMHRVYRDPYPILVRGDPSRVSRQQDLS
ncbi:hypothetical protein CORC01_01811 [Colletotrichum orchidophilum]|uniref:Uncharacterized protein n=1 Tax=Colletotrichum orchidophilum TaxID=1209926 RepID=A0A1G4BP28_9PEZI|nr:uncharacterized protein CORC01_01811 [Colletotrichum orchidophilum]OHF03053.1 hypothetical protein CORC01_01811 [Colletotrichum orchidophilum]